MYKGFVKRLLSIIISLSGLILLLPLIIVIAFIIKVDSKGNVIFKQKRLGRNYKEFTVYKFRTMVENAYQIGGIALHEGDPRITKVGTFLRKTSLDEVPQFINILKGDMCIIGPRPILKEEFEPYKSNKLYAKRFSIRPGLFCTVDVAYRASASRELQFEMDEQYVNNMSFKLDIDVFFKTFVTVIKRKNVYKEQDETTTVNNKQVKRS
jgi:lipopolysaccharide/colanic/teichoic acid biosynthesis glycosyltransferase